MSRLLAADVIEPVFAIASISAIFPGPMAMASPAVMRRRKRIAGFGEAVFSRVGRRVWAAGMGKSREGGVRGSGCAIRASAAGTSACRLSDVDRRIRTDTTRADGMTTSQRYIPRYISIPVLSSGVIMALVRPDFRRAVAFVAALLLSTAAAAADLTVSAAASLTNAFRELGTAFEAQNPGIKVQLNFAASGALLQQIVKGAPVDVLASADQETMDEAQKQGLVDPATRNDFVRNALVVIAPVDGRLSASGLADLRAERFAKIAIGQPASVPVGRYTKAVLEQAGLWAAVEPKMIGAQSVRQALDYVARGEVDAGFVYATDAAIMADKVRVLFAAPTPTPILYPIAVLRGAGDATTAKKFVQFVASPAARAVLARYGFGAP